MANHDQSSYTAFEGRRRIASGTLSDVVREVKRIIDRGERESILIFDDFSSELAEVDFRGDMEEILRRLEEPAAAEPSQTEPPARRKPGRPKLGVVAREVTLLPRHWDWLNSQPGAPPWRFANWWKKRGASTASGTKSVLRKRPRTASCPPWPGTCRASKRRRGPCSGPTPNGSTISSLRGRSISRIMRKSLRWRRSGIERVEVFVATVKGCNQWIGKPKYGNIRKLAAPWVFTRYGTR